MTTISGSTKLCMIIGSPVEKSLSPHMHNSAYEALGIFGEYVFVPATVESQDLGKAIEGVRAFGIRGVSITLPHKCAVMEYLDEIDEVAREIGAVNTIVNHDGCLRGFNTDWLGVVEPIGQRIDIRGRKAAVIGAGGAARAACFGLHRRGADVTVFNRTYEKGAALAQEIGATARRLTEIAAIVDFDIIVQMTTVGMTPHEDESPLPKDLLRPGHIVLDAIYRPHDTTLLCNARAAGAEIIPGIEMLLAQGVAQFELFTGRSAPMEVMRNELRLYIDTQ